MDRQTRPWGWWQVLDEGFGHKVKTLTVFPNHRLSYQAHAYRSEHWFVVAGTATCTIGAESVTLRAGDSVDVPIGARHRLANDEDTDLVVVEVQRGAYTGEDDIVRYEDDYGRTPEPASGTGA